MRFIPLIRNRIKKGVFRHGLMESCIKYRYVRNFWQNRFCCLNTGNVWRVVERSKMLDIFNRIKNDIINHDRASKLFPPMHHSVTYCRDIINLREHTMTRISQCFDNQSNRDLVIRTIRLMPVCLSTRHLV